ncbi:hypothetical protein ACJX0J_022256, partial [Zea mays]
MICLGYVLYLFSQTNNNFFNNIYFLCLTTCILHVMFNLGAKVCWGFFEDYAHAIIKRALFTEIFKTTWNLLIHFRSRWYRGVDEVAS